MRRTELLQELLQMRFLEAYEGYEAGRLSQEEASRLLGVCSRTFRRYLSRYEESLDLNVLLDSRLGGVSHRLASVDEVMDVSSLYQKRYSGWNVRHFHRFYQDCHGGRRSYTWVKRILQEAGLVKRAKGKGRHRKQRLASALPGMMLHQDASRHEWVPGAWWDLVVTMDDATNEHYSMFFVLEEGTVSSFCGIQETIERRGIFCSLYTDRGGHYWTTPEAGGKVDRTNLTQVGRALKQLGIEHIPAYSPEARGRSERAFKTHQGRLPQELALFGITTMEDANRYLQERYLPRFNAEFSHEAREEGSAFVGLRRVNIAEILCEQYERVVRNDNCVHFENKVLQIPENKHRMNYVKRTVRVSVYLDHTMAIFHGPLLLARYRADGSPLPLKSRTQKGKKTHTSSKAKQTEGASPLSPVLAAGRGCGVKNPPQPAPKRVIKAVKDPLRQAPACP
jgi:hypothetical protein